MSFFQGKSIFLSNANSEKMNKMELILKPYLKIFFWFGKRLFQISNFELKAMGFNFSDSSNKETLTKATIGMVEVEKKLK